MPGGSIPTDFGFTGEWTDPNDLLYLRARYYAPGTGVFTALDPFEGSASRPMSLNGYSWVEGNTPNRIDPSGALTQYSGLHMSSLLNGSFCSSLSQQTGPSPVCALFAVPCFISVAFPADNAVGVGFAIDAAACGAAVLACGGVTQLLSAAEAIPIPRPTVPDWLERLRRWLNEGVSYDPSKSGPIPIPRDIPRDPPESREIHIALGLKTEGRTGASLLLPFADNLTNPQREVVPYTRWSDYGIGSYTGAQFDRMSTEDFGEIVGEILELLQFTEIHVNLEGLYVFGAYNRNNLEEFVDDYAHPSGTAFAYELGYIEEFGLCRITTFYEDGSTLPRPVTTDLCS